MYAKLKCLPGAFHDLLYSLRPDIMATEYEKDTSIPVKEK